MTVRPQGADAASVHVEASILRSDFGLDWDALRAGGRLLVADNVRLSADILLTRVVSRPRHDVWDPRAMTERPRTSRAS